MTKQIINVGTTANDKKGDSLRAAFQKVNQNFTEVYDALTGGVSFNQVNSDWLSNSGVSQILNKPTIPSNTNQLTNGSGFITSSVTQSIIPTTDNTVDLGSPANRFRHLYVAPGTLYLGDVKLSNVAGKLVATKVVNAGEETEYEAPEDSDAFSNIGSSGNSVTNQLTNGNFNVTLNSAGLVTMPEVFPKTFRATVDAAHYSGQDTLSLTGDAWYFDVTFSALSNGNVETHVQNNTPWINNPGYTDSIEFLFTEADHGIPGYTFLLALINIQNPGPFMWTTNLIAGPAPDYPSSIASGETIKLTADATSWKFRPDGNFELPAGGDILDSNGASVLGGGSASTGAVTFSTNNIRGTNTLVLKATTDVDDYGVELYNSIDNDTHFRALTREKGIALGFAYGTWGSHIRVEGSMGQGGLQNSGDRVAIHAAREKLDDITYHGSDFYADVLYGGYILPGWGGSKSYGIEFDLFVDVTNTDFISKLTSYQVGQEVIVTYTTDGGVTTQTYTSSIQQQFANLGITDDSGLKTRVMGGIVDVGGYPPGTKAIISINFVDSTAAREAEWVFSNDGNLNLPSTGSIIGSDLVVKGISSVTIKVTNPMNPLATRDWGFSGNGHLTFPNGTTQTTAWTGTVTKTIQTVDITAPTTITASVVFADPNAAGAPVNLILPSAPANGTVITVKNINASLNAVYVQTDGIDSIETETGTIGGGVYATIPNTGNFITWIYESSTSTYRIIG